MLMTFNKMLRKARNKKGFTMIELIIVIAIIAVLAAILIPQYIGFRDSAVERAALALGRNIATAHAAMVALDRSADIDEEELANFILPGATDFEALVATDGAIVTAVGTPDADGFTFTYEQSGINKTVKYTAGDGKIAVTDTTP